MDKPGCDPPNIPIGLGRAGEHFVSDRDGAVMVWIPPGPFFMGRPDDDLFAKPHEKPGRTVQLPGFFMDRFPVTNRQYRLFVEGGGYTNPDFWCWEGWEWLKGRPIEGPLAWDHDDFRGQDHPAAGVNWYEACAYARWAGKRLPSEAEWEKGARGIDARPFPWGRDFPTNQRANFDHAKGFTTPVGAYPQGASPFGLMDMAGNVNNWCLDWYHPGFYSHCAEEGIDFAPLLDTGTCERMGWPRRRKVDRGGGFATPFEHLEVLSCTDKTAWPPETRSLWNGFRCVKTI